MAQEELGALLNWLLEAERAGAKLLAAYLAELQLRSELFVRLRDVQRDEAHNCAVLIHFLLEAEIAPSTATGDFYDKGLLIREWPARLEFLNRGQAWVARRLAAALPRIPGPATRRRAAGDARIAPRQHPRLRRAASCAGNARAGRVIGCPLLRKPRWLPYYRSTRQPTALIEAVGAHLQRKGLKVSSGTIVDATIIAAPSSTKNAQGKRDPEMHQTKKGKDWHFGMKAHVGVDKKTKLIHSVAATPASTGTSLSTIASSTGRARASVPGSSTRSG